MNDYETYQKMAGIEQVFRGLIKMGYNPRQAAALIKEEILDSLVWKNDDDGDLSVHNFTLAMIMAEKEKLS
jgi:hypothetical protein